MNTYKKREKIHKILEKTNKLNYDYPIDNGKWTMPGKDFKYRQNAFHSSVTFIVRCILQTLGPVFIKIAYGAKVEGKENLKKIKDTGAICICNHCYYLDTLFVRQAVGHFRTYFTCAPKNNKTGLAGAIIRHGGVLPFSSHFSAMRNLDKEIGRLLSKGKIINFYAEQAMWMGYQKPRPLKKGAFIYAVKYNVPVLPLFCTFDKTKSGKIKKLRIHILPPVYPDNNLSKSKNAENMRDIAQNSWNEIYNSAYNTEINDT